MIVDHPPGMANQMWAYLYGRNIAWTFLFLLVTNYCVPKSVHRYVQPRLVLFLSSWFYLFFFQLRPLTLLLYLTLCLLFVVFFLIFPPLLLLLYHLAIFTFSCILFSLFEFLYNVLVSLLLKFCFFPQISFSSFYFLQYSVFFHFLYRFREKKLCGDLLSPFHSAQVPLF